MLWNDASNCRSKIGGFPSWSPPLYGVQSFETEEPRTSTLQISTVMDSPLFNDTRCHQRFSLVERSCCELYICYAWTISDVMGWRFCKASMSRIFGRSGYLQPLCNLSLRWRTLEQGLEVCLQRIRFLTRLFDYRHSSFAGKRNADGSFKSHNTSEYPEKLSDQIRKCLHVEQMRSDVHGLWGWNSVLDLVPDSFTSRMEVV